MRFIPVWLMLWVSSLGLGLLGCRKQPVANAAPSDKKTTVIRIDGPVPKFKPLIIIDNVKQPSRKKINIDPNDIVSLDVPKLNRAQAIQLYGRRARDGVVIIKTKKLDKMNGH